MQDSTISKTRNKVFPRPRPELVIEKVTKYRSAFDPYRHGDQSSGLGSNARQVPMSLPRIKWLERPDV